jgi:altronate dehydratase large subunit
MEFMGFERSDGSYGTRNHVSIIPTVACANEVGCGIAAKVKTAVTFPHHQGCCQLRPDVDLIERTLIGFGENPNTGGALVVSLGCETVDAKRIAGAISRAGKEVEIVNIQELGGYSKAVRKGTQIANAMAKSLSKNRRKRANIEALTIGLKCGASDTTSGLVSNRAVGEGIDRVISEGGTVIMGETTEFIGAEHILARRAKDQNIQNDILTIVKNNEDRIKASGVDMRGSQPTPGNIAGGLTTIEEKSLGGIVKSGTSAISGVLKYSERPKGKGLYLMDTPAFEPYALSALAAASAQVILFTTGVGAPHGFPLVPVVKVTGNPKTEALLSEHIDVGVSDVLEGRTTLEEASKRVLERVIDVASGKRTKAEILGYDKTIDIYVRGPII